MESIIIKLDTPVQGNGEELTELKLRRPKGKDYRTLTSVTPFGMALELAGKLAEVPPSTIDALDADDVKKVVEAVSPFLS
jgi:hypothetical protein